MFNVVVSDHQFLICNLSKEKEFARSLNPNSVNYFSFLVVVLVFGCGGGSKPKPKPPTPGKTTSCCLFLRNVKLDLEKKNCLQGLKVS